MAYLIQPDYVKYLCSCGQQKAIVNLYFCRHCLKIRCGFCICHEVDSHYCANCLENMPSSEARLKKNRCSSCFDCPSCFHTLSTRATLAPAKQTSTDAASGGGDTKVENKQPKKMYYLSCFNCRWTSRDVGIPDQPVASGGWPERINPHQVRVNELLEYYKALAQQEKQEKLDKERKKFNIRGKYITLTDKTGLTGAMARNIAGLPSTDASASIIANFTPSPSVADVEPLPDDFYTKEVNINEIPTMAQRLACPEWQPTHVSLLHPIPKLLSVKRSQRCRDCDHNLTKPEYNPGSVRFKIELLAYYHVPEIKIISCEPLSPGQKSTLVLKVTNPTSHEISFRLIPVDSIPQPPLPEPSGENLKGNEKEPPISKSLEQRVEVYSNARPSLPTPSLRLSQRDDAAEYDDDCQTNEHVDLILWRKCNKLALSLIVEPNADLKPGELVYTALGIEYTYRNTVPPSATQPRQPQDHTLYTTVQIQIGSVV